MASNRTTTTAGLEARAAAAELLETVLARRIPLDQALDRAMREGALAPLDTRDRGFARLIVMTTLRRLGVIDAVLDALLEKPLPRKARRTTALLRTAVAQLCFLGTPPHAAVGSTVQLLRSQRPTARYAGLANAVLRRLAREGLPAEISNRATELDTPSWLLERWQRTYGAEKAAEIAEAHRAEPPLDITVRDDPEGWAQRLGGEVLPTGSVRLNAGGRVEDLDGFADGEWWVQDAAAALPARLLGDVAGLDVLDLCAAPGGKTAQLAAAGAGVTALDRSGPRLQRLAETLARLDLAAELVEADAGTWTPERTWPRILLDAPCSATGTVRRHPDIPWLKSPKDIEKLAAAQARLLRAAVGLLEPGGILVYCTCSLEPEEGPAQVANLLDEVESLRRVPVDPAEVGDIDELVTPEGDVRTLPCHLAEKGGLDGFYAARLTRD